MEFMVTLNAIAIIINMVSWLSGSAIAIYSVYRGFKDHALWLYLKKAVYIGFLTFLDFQTVSIIRYLLGGGYSTTLGISTALACAIISIGGIWLRSVAGRRILTEWLRKQSKVHKATT